ncbi:hypothetical protein E2C01_062576 [Portunus trituberculatus]|uniref:Uncharacterized protein n=1 Tax=Portunus trituberculatus TaxID=210409 RepID=A0A5B7HEE4_PORTR|nr:hypothetical protein [Portunus trituberculatus]
MERYEVQTPSSPGIFVEHGRRHSTRVQPHNKGRDGERRATKEWSELRKAKRVNKVKEGTGRVRCSMGDG